MEPNIPQGKRRKHPSTVQSLSPMGGKEKGRGVAASFVSLLPSRECGEVQSMGWKYDRGKQNIPNSKGCLHTHGSSQQLGESHHRVFLSIALKRFQPK